MLQPEPVCLLIADISVVSSALVPNRAHLRTREAATT